MGHKELLVIALEGRVQSWCKCFVFLLGNSPSFCYLRLFEAASATEARGDKKTAVVLFLKNFGSGWNHPSPHSGRLTVSSPSLTFTDSRGFLRFILGSTVSMVLYKSLSLSLLLCFLHIKYSTVSRCQWWVTDGRRSGRDTLHKPLTVDFQAADSHLFGHQTTRRTRSTISLSLVSFKRFHFAVHAQGLQCPIRGCWAKV